MRSVSAREANQQFARLLKEVEAGGEIVVTRRGVPVARLSPVQEHRRLTPAQEEARARTRARLSEGWPLGGERLDRDRLHDRE